MLKIQLNEIKSEKLTAQAIAEFKQISVDPRVVMVYNESSPKRTEK